jgi:hypothetical protein
MPAKLMFGWTHELASFPNVKFDDQADSTSQALGWFKEDSMNSTLGYIDFLKQMEAKEKAAGGPFSNSPMINRGALLREWDRGNTLYARRW